MPIEQEQQQTEQQTEEQKEEKKDDKKDEKKEKHPRRESVPKIVKFLTETPVISIQKGLFYNPEPEEENLRYDNVVHIKRGIQNPDPSTLPKPVHQYIHSAQMFQG